MKTPTIEISQHFGQIGIKITQPDLNLRIKAPDLNIHTQQPELDLHTTQPEEIIDLHESFDSMGLKGIASVAKTIGDEAKQTALNGGERRAQEETELEKAKRPSVSHLADRASKPQEKQLLIGLMPDAPPRITAELGIVKGNYTPGDVVVKLDSGEVKGNFTWGTVDVYMEREPYVDIRA